MLVMSGIAASNAASASGKAQPPEASGTVAADSPFVMAVGARLANGAGATSGTCMETEANGGEWALIYMATCHSNAHQSWYFTAHTGGYVAIRSHDQDASGRCVTAPILQNNFAQMESCPTVGQLQAWVVTQRTDGWFQLRNKGDNTQCLEVGGNGMSGVVQAGDCGPVTGPGTAGYQLWKWRSVG